MAAAGPCPSGLVRTWKGPRSGILFQAADDAGAHHLTIRIDSEMPVVLHLQFETSRILEQYGRLFDLSCAVARDPACACPEDIVINGLGLIFCRDLFEKSAERIANMRDTMRDTMPPGSERARTIRDHDSAVARMKSISRRIEKACELHLPADMFACIAAVSDRRQQH